MPSIPLEPRLLVGGSDLIIVGRAPDGGPGELAKKLVAVIYNAGEHHADFIAKPNGPPISFAEWVQREIEEACAFDGIKLERTMGASP